MNVTGRAIVVKVRSVQENEPLTRFVQFCWSLMPSFHGASDFHKVSLSEYLLFHIGIQASAKYAFIQGASKYCFTSALKCG